MLWPPVRTPIWPARNERFTRGDRVLVAWSATLGTRYLRAGGHVPLGAADRRVASAGSTRPAGCLDVRAPKQRLQFDSCVSKLFGTAFASIDDTE